jgi:type IX secretion system PorP/SprF family membrane protein
MKKSVLILILVLCSMLTYAQQVGMYSHSFYKPMIVNPAFAGADEFANAMLISRNQWTNFKGAPQQTLFTADGNIMEKKVGIGLSLSSERKGLTSKIGGNMFYSYKLELNKDMSLALGLALGVADQTINFSNALVETPSDPTLYTDSQHKTVFTADAGLAFAWKDLKIGLAIPQLMGTKLKSADYVDSVTVHAYYTQVRHYMFSAQYRYFIAKEKGISIVPMAIMRIVPHAPFQFDGTVNIDWENKFWAGITYKSKYALALNVGICLQKQLCIGYSYEIITGSIGKYAGISHEIMINFKLAKNKKADVVPEAGAKGGLVNADYETQLEDLQNRLKTNQAKLKELNDKLDKQVNASQQPTVSVSDRSGVEDSDGIYVAPKADFKDSQNEAAVSDYYVVVGIFFYRDFADAEVKNYIKKGAKDADIVYSEVKKNNYVFVLKTASKEEALKKAKELNGSDSSNAWVLKLID